MRLIVGGAGQGKLDHALKSSGLESGDVAFCHSEEPNEIFSKKVIYGLHDLVERLLSQGIPPLEYIMERAAPEHIIICNEVGCGVVPIEKSQREYRDAVGLVCQRLAVRATVVERVCCGIAIKIKG